MKIKPCYDGGTCANEVLIEELESLVAAAAALAVSAEKAVTELGLMFEGNFVSWSGMAQDALRELDTNLREYREAHNA